MEGRYMNEEAREIKVYIERSCDGSNLGQWRYIVYIDGEAVIDSLTTEESRRLIKALEQALEETE